LPSPIKTTSLAKTLQGCCFRPGSNAPNTSK
jgi:hypothetical protein